MKVTIKDSKGPRWRNYQKALNFLGGGPQSIEVGHIEGDASQESVNKGLWNEVGHNNRPARPWLSTTYDANEKKYVDMLVDLFGEALRSGDPEKTSESVRKAIGEQAERDLREAILAWTKPPNAERTVQRKDRNDPLVETGQMAEEVGYRLTSKSAKE